MLFKLTVKSFKTVNIEDGVKLYQGFIQQKSEKLQLLWHFKNYKHDYDPM